MTKLLEGFWRKRDGSIVRIKEMTTDHIQNCIAMMERNNFVSEKTFDMYMAGPAAMIGEMAEDAFWYEFNSVTRKRPSRLLDSLIEELKLR